MVDRVYDFCEHVFYLFLFFLMAIVCHNMTKMARKKVEWMDTEGRKNGRNKTNVDQTPPKIAKKWGKANETRIED